MLRRNVNIKMDYNRFTISVYLVSFHYDIIEVTSH